MPLLALAERHAQHQHLQRLAVFYTAFLRLSLLGGAEALVPWALRALNEGVERVVEVCAATLPEYDLARADAVALASPAFHAPAAAHPAKLRHLLAGVLRRAEQQASEAADELAVSCSTASQARRAPFQAAGAAPPPAKRARNGPSGTCVVSLPELAACCVQEMHALAALQQQADKRRRERQLARAAERRDRRQQQPPLAKTAWM